MAAIVTGVSCYSILVAEQPRKDSSSDAAIASATFKTAEHPIDLGNRKQLLLDDRLIANSRNITLRMNPPVKMGPAVLADRPWEKEIGFCVSVIEHDGLYKMWYLAQGTGKFYVCCATSQDGIKWEKPSLGLIECNGSKGNNIVMKDVLETMVFLDPVAPPESRFKALSQALDYSDPKKGGLYIHTSHDGIHWKISDQRVCPIGADTANQAFYDTRLKKYVAHIRVWAPPDIDPGGEGMGRRKIGRIETDDITHSWPVKQIEKPYYIWGEGKLPVATYEVPTTFSYDERDPANSDHYNPASIQYPWADNAYFMFPSAYRHSTGLLDIQMATSRDGVSWMRPSREPYVSLGTQEEFDHGSLYMAAGMVRREGKIFQYYGGCRVTHLAGAVDSKPQEPTSHILRLEQRLDGFVSADADIQGGEFTTPPLLFSGTQLVLNANASAMGTCKVEILDGQGHPMPGYSLDDSEELTGNHIERVMRWKGNADLSAIAGRVVQLRFVMRSCKLYAFQFP